MDSTPVSLSTDTVSRIQEELRRQDLDGWLLYDFHGLNPIACSVLGLGALSRRYFALIPPEGQPLALTHRIEQLPWNGWIGQRFVYLTWQELETGLAELLRGRRRVAMEYSPGDAVPYLDRVPAGVLELVRRTGVEVVGSADLVTAFHARWSEADLKSHRRASRVVRETVHEVFERVGTRLRAGEEAREVEMLDWMRGRLREQGLTARPDGIVAIGRNAADPHYVPTDARSNCISPGDVLLVDSWGAEPGAPPADQTWIGYVGRDPSERIRTVWAAVRDARDAAVDRIGAAWSSGEAITGADVDDAARELLVARGFGARFIHRTGHSIDHDLHGSGPHLDNLETHDTRRLREGCGMSVEPGVYVDGEVGMRSEVNLYLGPDGPKITTPESQEELILIP